MSGLEDFIRIGTARTPTRRLQQLKQLGIRAHMLSFDVYQSGDSDPRRMLSAWPKNLQLGLVADSEISTLDIQAWIRQTKAPLVRLEYTKGTDKCYFDNLVETLRNARGVSLFGPRRLSLML